MTKTTLAAMAQAQKNCIVESSEENQLVSEAIITKYTFED